MDSDGKIREGSSSEDSGRRGERKDIRKALSEFKIDILNLTKELKAEFKIELNLIREEFKTELNKNKDPKDTSRSQAEIKRSINGHRLQLNKFLSQCDQKKRTGGDTSQLQSKGLYLIKII
jgi:hypothetical protein